MKLADLFVALGFQISGSQELKNLENSMLDLAGNATKVLAVVGSMTASLGVMLHQALDTADGFRRFTAVTGLSTEELQRWKFAAAKAGVGGEELVGTIESIQTARADIMMGRGNVAPWQLLGIAPSQNPFDTLRALKDRIKDLDPAVARSIVGQMGIGNGVFALMRLTNQEFNELEKNLVITEGETRTLNKFNTAWNVLRLQLGAVRDRLVAQLLPAFTKFVEVINKGVLVLGKFTNWLSKGSAGAGLVKAGLVAVIAVIVGLTVALTVLIGGIGLLTAAIALLELIASPLGAFMLILVATFATMAVQAAACALIFEDLWVMLQGGDSVFKDLGEWLDSLLEKLLKFLGIWDEVKKAAVWTYSKANGLNTDSGDPGKTQMNPKAKTALDWIRGHIFSDPKAGLEQQALALAPVNNQSSSVNQENNIDVHVDGGKNPHEDGQIAGKQVAQAIKESAYQIASLA